MRLLVVEDNDQLADLICKGLKAAGFDSDRAARIVEAEDAIQASSYGAMIVDLGLPDGDGRNLVSALRAKGDATPVLMLSSRASGRCCNSSPLLKLLKEAEWPPRARVSTDDSRR